MRYSVFCKSHQLSSLYCGWGHQPKWIKEALAKGKTLEEFLTQQPEEQPETAAKEQRGEAFAL